MKYRMYSINHTILCPIANWGGDIYMKHYNQKYEHFKLHKQHMPTNKMSEGHLH